MNARRQELTGQDLADLSQTLRVVIHHEDDLARELGPGHALFAHHVARCARLRRLRTKIQDRLLNL